MGLYYSSAAYMAEVIRGGLQAIPKGQYEAADALGYYWKKTGLIILPQALKSQSLQSEHLYWFVQRYQSSLDYRYV